MSSISLWVSDSQNKVFLVVMTVQSSVFSCAMKNSSITCFWLWRAIHTSYKCATNALIQTFQNPTFTLMSTIIWHANGNYCSFTVEYHVFARTKVVRERKTQEAAEYFQCVSLNDHLLIASPCCLLARCPRSLIRRDSPIITSVWLWH